jgi:hypothetical protein
MFETPKYCVACGTTGRPKTREKGSVRITLVLFLFLIIPAVIYSLWRRSSRYQACRTCGATTLVPLNSPVALRELSAVGGGPQSAPVVRVPSGSSGAIVLLGSVALLVFIIAVGSVSRSGDRTPTATSSLANVSASIPSGVAETKKTPARKIGQRSTRGRRSSSDEVLDSNADEEIAKSTALDRANEEHRQSAQIRFVRAWLAQSESVRREKAPTLTWEQVNALPSAQMLPEEIARWSQLNPAASR